MRTYEEIVARVEEILAQGFVFDFQAPDLICKLPYEHAKPFLNDDCTKEIWEKEGVPAIDRETILKEMLDYMPFAWEKANDKRGLSASRSMDHYAAWVWLLGDDLGDLTDYKFYGKDHLVTICERYGWDHTQWDDGVRENS